MGLFDKQIGPVFLKEDSDLHEYLNKLSELNVKATGKSKEAIEKEIRIASLGEFGENNIIFELKNSGMPMYILHDVYLVCDELHAQIDFIVVTRKATFIIECKNLVGDIELDNEGNFFRNYEFRGKKMKEGLYSPLTQNQRHLEVLRRLRRQQKVNILTQLLFDKFFDERYQSIVVLANPKTVLYAKYAKKDVKQMVIRADRLNSFIKEFNEKSTAPSFNDKELREHAESLLHMHTLNKFDYTKRFEELLNSSEEKEEKKEVNQVIGEGKFQQPATASFRNTDDLVVKLKAFRLSRSREEMIKPYFIFNDLQMMDLIQKLPTSKESLQEVSGFGKVKVEKYGDSIIKILNEWTSGC